MCFQCCPLDAPLHSGSCSMCGTTLCYWLPCLAGCPHLPGYDLYPNLVSNTSTYSSLPAANVTDLSALCSADPQCLAFTTWGDLKSGLMNYTDWSLIDTNWVFGGLPVLLSCQGMYVKVLVSSAGGEAHGSVSTPPKASMVVSPPQPCSPALARAATSRCSRYSAGGCLTTGRSRAAGWCSPWSSVTTPSFPSHP